MLQDKTPHTIPYHSIPFQSIPFPVPPYLSLEWIYFFVPGFFFFFFFFWLYLIFEEIIHSFANSFPFSVKLIFFFFFFIFFLLYCIRVFLHHHHQHPFQISFRPFKNEIRSIFSTWWSFFFLHRYMDGSILNSLFFKFCFHK